MSRTRNWLVLAAGAAAGLFMTALATSASAAADTAAPSNPAPGLPGLVSQVVTSPASIPQQILQTTTSALTGAPATPATPPPLASASVNLPNPASATGSAPVGQSNLPGVSGVPGIPGTGDLSRMLPVPMPNFGTAPAAPVRAPGATIPGLAAPQAPAISPFPVSGLP
ncbi:hypothetical protein [Mycobacterium talmoniae]|uniref:Exported repetitive protein n=1 Tax=Mycobacterium talmoniae TaxID=1858794 RepID=A0A1S1NQ19_9MYCO|nr:MULTISPECIES: hypothetical protein [Mycobacterium]OHV05569.1 hypothetical protein BKN37_05130 [Mycobacterium talmoniae]TDH55469.1 hypothetical protein E2F47_09660 [Mycobacterium eburneum]